MAKYNALSLSKRGLQQTLSLYSFKHGSHIELDWFLRKCKRRSRQLRYNYKYILAELANKSGFIKAPSIKRK